MTLERGGLLHPKRTIIAHDIDQILFADERLESDALQADVGGLVGRLDDQGLRRLSCRLDNDHKHALVIARRQEPQQLPPASGLNPTTTGVEYPAADTRRCATTFKPRAFCSGPSGEMICACPVPAISPKIMSAGTKAADSKNLIFQKSSSRTRFSPSKEIGNPDQMRS